MISIDRLVLRLPHDYAGRERQIATAIAEALGRVNGESLGTVARSSVQVAGLAPHIGSRAIGDRIAAAVADNFAAPRPSRKAEVS